MKYDRDWRKLYRHEPLDQCAWPLFARALRDHLIRYPNELDGYLLTVPGDTNGTPPDTTGQARDNEKIIGTLLKALHAHDDERDFVVRALEILIRDTYLVVDTDGRVSIRNFNKAQRSKEAIRKKNWRDKQSGTSTGHKRDTAGHVPKQERDIPARAPARTRGDQIRSEEKRSRSNPPSGDLTGRPKAPSGRQGRNFANASSEAQPVAPTEPATPRKPKPIPGGGGQWKS